MVTNLLNNKVDQLLDVLEKDVRHIELSLERLDMLRGLVIKRDEKSLQALLEQLQRYSDSYAMVEAQRQTLMNEIAELAGLSPDNVSLGMLAECFDQQRAQKILDKRDTLRRLTARLMTEHRATGMLLAECARFNGQLLSSLVRAAKSDSMTYGRDGQVSRQNQAAFMNFKM